MIHRLRLWNAALCSLAALLFIAASCPPTQEPVTITFDQVGACNGYQRTSGPGGSGPHVTVSAGPDAAFVAFRIVSIDNSKSGQDFNFDPERIYVSGTSPGEFVDTNLALAQDQGPLKAVATTIPNGQNVGNSGIAVISVFAANEAPEANNTSYTLSYDRAPADPPVLLAKRNLSQTSWPQTNDCLAIRF